MHPLEVSRLICQDNEGYLWFVNTKKGFIRYDGHKFGYVKENTGDDLGTAHPTGCIQDKSGQLWVSTRDGLREINTANLNVVSHQANPDDWENPLLPRQSHINKMIVDATGTIWFLGSSYVFYFDEITKEFIKTFDFSKDDDPTPFDGEFDDIGNLWISMFSGGIHKTNNGKIVKIYSHSKDALVHQSIDGITTLRSMGNSKLWVGSSDGLYEINDETNKVNRIFEQEIQEGITRIVIEDKNNVWVAGSKVYHINLKTNKVTTYFFENSNNPSVSLFVDRENTVWVSFVDGGTFKFVRSNMFLSFDNPYGPSANHNTTREITSWLEDTDHILWLGTTTGIYKYNTQSKISESIEALSNEIILDTELFNDDYILVATAKNIYKLSKNTHESELITPISNEGDHPFARLNDIMLIDQRYIWISYMPGIKVYDMLDKTMEINPEYIQKNIRATGLARFLESKDKQKIYITAYNYGFFIYDKKTKITEEHLHTSKEVPSWSMNNIKAAGNDIYIYYDENYVSKYNTITKEFSVLDMPVNGVSCIETLHDKRYLFQTNGDVYEQDINTRSLKNLTSSKNPLTETITANDCKVLDSNKIITTTYEGLLIIDPKNIRDDLNPVKPLLSLGSMNVNGTSRIVNYNEPIILESSETMITIPMASHSYVEPSLNKYRYRLVDEHQWVDTDHLNSNVVYSNLGYGKHYLEVQASNNTGVWSDIKKVEIVVNTPFYKSKFAYALYFIFVLCTVFLLLRNREKHRAELKIIEADKIEALELANKDLTKAHSIAIQQREIAEDATKTKDKFMANISHELRTPLTGIRGLIELLGFTNLNSTQTRYLKSCDGCVGHMIRHVESLLDLTRLKNGAFETVYSNFSIENWFDELSFLVQPLIEKGNLEFQIEKKLDPFLKNKFIQSDPEALKQVALNIITNAIKFTEKGRITITLDCEVLNNSAYVKICIEDSGIGIASDKLETIFGDFVQLQNPSTKARGGAGLGLSISKGIMDDIGGDIIVSSIINKGSSFTMSFTSEIHDSFDARIIEKKMEQKILNAVNVLVIEDNDINREIATELLTYAEANVDAASDGETALTLMSLKNYDVLFLDCHMPKMDGFQLAEEIRKREKQLNKNEQVQIIALTADVSERSKERCIRSGMNSFIAKPYMSTDLITAINNYIECKNGVGQVLRKLSNNNKLKEK